MGTNASLFDRVGELLSQGGTLNRISETIEEDLTTTRRLATEATAVLIAGSARRLSSGAIDGVAAASPNTAVGDGVENVPVGWPASMLLGERWPSYVEGLAEFNGVAVEQAQLVVRRVAPVVLAVVQEQEDAQDLNRFQLARILHQERKRVMGLGLLSWAPHPGMVTTARVAPSKPPLDASRNVVKHRRPPSVGRARDAANAPIAPEEQPPWLWWSLLTILVVLTVAWLLSQTL